jgi:diadenylate cyclase
MIIFQPELRNALEKLGRNKLLKSTQQKETNVDKLIADMLHATEYLSKRNTGALISIEMEDSLTEYIKTGINLNANISKELLINIFTPNVPLHDGALIIKGNRLEAASCYLPLSQSTNISKELGTRHRAAIGISEATDALTIIVSEETGSISITKNSKIYRGISIDELRNHLEIFLIIPDKVKPTSRLRGNKL